MVPVFDYPLLPNCSHQEHTMFVGLEAPHLLEPRYPAIGHAIVQLQVTIVHRQGMSATD